MAAVPRLDPEPVPPLPPSRASLLVVYLTVFLDLMGFGILLPLMPYYAIHFGATGLGLGALFASFSVAQLLGAPLLGRLSDRLGRKPVLMVSLLGAAVAYVATGIADSLLTLMAARALAGLFAGSISTAQAYVADVTTPQERAKYMGLIGASIGMGFVLGPWIGSELSRFGFSTAAFVSAGLSLFNCLFGLVALRESRRRVSAVRHVALTPSRLTLAPAGADAHAAKHGMAPPSKQPRPSKSSPFTGDDWRSKAPADRKVAADSLRLTRHIVSQPALQRYQPREVRPGVQFQSDEELARLAGDIGTTIFHPVGTCKMGRFDDATAVVDSRLRLMGVDGVRIDSESM